VADFACRIGDIAAANLLSQVQELTRRLPLLWSEQESAGATLDSEMVQMALKQA
jgi:hypothetical protein